MSSQASRRESTAARDPKTTRVRIARREVPLVRDAERTRALIIKAALHEFAEQGVAGARTDAIARAAGVNKALLYYYYRDKESLYGEVLDQSYARLHAHLMAALDNDLAPRLRFQAYVKAHFDFVAANPEIPRIVQGEMMRAGNKSSPHLERLVERHLRPIFTKLAEVIEQGTAIGEFRRVNPIQFLPSVVATIIFYFQSGLMYRLMTGQDPFTPQRIADRRNAVVEFVSAALFRTGLGSEPTTQSNKGRRP